MRQLPLQGKEGGKALLEGGNKSIYKPEQQQQ